MNWAGKKTPKSSGTEHPESLSLACIKPEPVKHSRLCTVLLAAVLLFGCRRDGQGPTWDTGLLFPIAHTSMSIDDLVPDSLLQTNSDSSLKLVYENDFFNFSADSLYKIRDTTLPYNAQLFPGSFTAGTTFANVFNNTTYSLPNGIQLVNGIIRTGMMKLHMVNQAHGVIEVRLQLPHSYKNNIALDTTFLIPAGNGTGGPDGVRDAEIPLDGYTCDFRGQLYDRVNTLLTQYTVRYDPQATSNLVTNSGEAVNMLATFTGIVPEYVRGYFGNSTFNLSGESDVSFFKKIRGGTLGLESLTMRVDLENNVGADARLYLNGIHSRNTRTNNTVSLNAPFIGNPVNINRATYSSGWPPVTPFTWSTQVDNSNSNAKALLENLPDKLGYDVKIITNPLGNVSGSNDFFYTDFPMKAKLSAEMPLSFMASNLLLEDTLKPDFTGVKNKEDILSGTVTIYAGNSFPFSAALQLYLLDGSGSIIDSIISLPNVIAAGPSAYNSSNNIVSTGETQSVVKLTLNEIQMQEMLNSNRLIIRTLFNTSGQPANVKIFNYNRISLKLTGDFNYRIGG